MNYQFWDFRDISGNYIGGADHTLDQELFDNINTALKNRNSDLYLMKNRFGTVWIMSKHYNTALEEFNESYFNKPCFIHYIRYLDNYDNDKIEEVKKCAYFGDLVLAEYAYESVLLFIEVSKGFVDRKFKIENLKL